MIENKKMLFYMVFIWIFMNVFVVQQQLFSL